MVGGLVNVPFLPSLCHPPAAAADCERDISKPCSQLSRALCSRSFPFPSHLSLCPAGRKAMPICPSQPRPTSRSDQLGARIPTASLSLSSAETGEVQESQLICSARFGACEFEWRRAVPVLMTQEPAVPSRPSPRGLSFQWRVQTTPERRLRDVNLWSSPQKKPHSST